MDANLCIEVYCNSKTQTRETLFFETGEWTPETEKQLLAKIQELLFLFRNLGEKIEILVNIDVSNLNAATFLLNKKKDAQPKINNQKLSIREIEVLGLIMQGLTNNDIAEKLFICYETVKSHRKNILEKTGAKNTAALINYYHQTFFEK
jgi:DNA-binding CsgD family transcriptional regulator